MFQRFSRSGLFLLAAMVSCAVHAQTDPSTVLVGASGQLSSAATPTTAAAVPPNLFGVSGGGSVELGQKVTLQVTFNGTGEDQSYQWRRNGTNLAGTTAVTYVIEAVTPADTATYTVEVSNSAGSSVASTDVTVKPAAAPVIATQPRTTTASVNQVVIFSFVATGSYPRTYQWRKDGNNIAGGTAASLALPAVTIDSAGAYSVVITNAVGTTTSSPASLTVNAATPPVLSTFSPSDVSVTQGDSPLFFISVSSGSTPYTFQWMKGGTPIPGATSGSLVINSVALTDAGKYSVVVTNIAGSATSREATLTVSAPIPLTFSFHSQSQTLFQGQALSLNSLVNGSSPITYQWRKNGTNLAGATGSSFSISSIAISDSGSYIVVATNPAGSVTSNPAVVTVNPPVAPTITTQPSAQTAVAFNGTINLSVQAAGSPPLTFAWRKDGVAGTGNTNTNSTGSSYSFSSATPAQSGSYTVVVTNSVGSVTSNVAVVTVAAPVLPIIVNQPTDRSVAVGLSTSFSVNASTGGAGTVTSQWLKNGVPIPGAAGSNYSIAAVKDTDAGIYTLQITGAAGTVISAPARLTVLPPSPPIVNSWPFDRTTELGSSLTFTLGSPQGPGPFAFQWYKEGALIAGATGSSLNLPNTSLSDLGGYLVVVSNDGGIVASPPFNLTLQTSSSTSPWVAASQLGTTAYFLATSPARIERYDLSGDRWLPTVVLSETQVPTAFLPLAEGVYIAYGRTLVRRSPDLTTETALTNVGADITALFALDDFLYYNAATSSNSSPTLASLRRSTLAAGPTNSFLYSRPAVAPRSHRVYSSSSFNRSYPIESTVASDGRLTVFTPPSTASYPPVPMGDRIYVFPSEDYIANNAGTLFRAGDLTYVGSIGIGLDDLTFLGDGTPVALRDHVVQLLGAPNFIETGRMSLPFRGMRAFGTDSSVVVFGAAASAGGAFRATKVPRTSFLPVVVPAAATPANERFTVDGIFAGADGVIGIFSRSKQALLRWSSVTRAYLPPVPLRGQPTFTSQTSSATRVLFSYADGTLTEVPVRAAATDEHQIGMLGNRAWVVTDLTDMAMINVRAYSDSGDFRLVLGAQGQTLYGTGATGYANAGMAWQPATRRLYSGGSSSSGSTNLGYEVVPVTGVLGNPNGPSSGATVTGAVNPPLRFNPEGTLLATGNGRVLNADLAQVGVLANNVVDAAWLATGLFSLRANADGDSTVQRWDRLTYLQSGTLTLRGSPQRILRLSDTQLLVISSILGFLSYTFVNSDLSLALPPAGISPAGVYAGTFGPAGDAGVFSLYVRPDRSGVLLVQLAGSSGALLATDVLVGADGSFFSTSHTLDASASRIVAGSISAAGVVSGTIPSLNLSFSGPKSAGDATSAGFYSALALNGATGSAYVIVGDDGRALFVAQASSKTDGGIGSVATDGTFTVIAASGTKITGALNVGAGSLTATGATGTAFAGLRDGIAHTDRLANISTRGRAGPGDDVMIAGFVLTGSAPRPVLIRAIGPTLGSFGVPGTLADPRLELYRGSAKLAENDNWSTANDLVATTARVGGFALAAGSADAALLVTLDPGAYSAQVSGPGNTIGNALVEVYDAGQPSAPGVVTPRLINIATRGRLASADDTLIAGIVVTGNAPKRLLIRAIGPGLAAFGVAGTLADPMLVIAGPTASGATPVASNDDWGSGSVTAAEIAATSVAVGAFALPDGSRDACLLLTLAPGNYTAQVFGKNNGTGAVLIEVYEINP